MPRDRGSGHVYLRGSRWWIAYYRDGRLHREPAGRSEAAAEKKLKAILRQSDDVFLPPRVRKLTISDLLDDLMTHLRVKGIASLPKVLSHLKSLRDALGALRAMALDTPRVEAYQRERLEARKAAATVNRECELLRQAYRLAHRRTPPRVNRVPFIPMLTVENARQGFVPRADFLALIAKLTDLDVRDFLEWLWWTGMRPKEIRQLTWAMLDRETWTLRLDPKAAKTRYGRVIPLPANGPLRAIVNRRLTRRRLDCPLIFHRVSRGLPGQPIRDYRRQWKAALKDAKLPAGLLPYDLRRTAPRNMVRGGTDYSVAMKLSGHRTRSTFDRYNITSEDDLRAALERTVAYVETLPTERNVAEFPPEHSQFIHSAAPERKAASSD